MTRSIHRMPFGAELAGEGGARFRLWAPAARRVDLCLESGTPRNPLPMPSQEDGWFELLVPEAGAGDRYRYLIDGRTHVPDPASRFQPSDVHEASEIVDPEAYEWADGNWAGRPWEEAVLYELHVGAFTAAGTYRGVSDKLEYLSSTGITAVELMPLAEAPGRRNWGYDGVLPFAPQSAYGRPDELKSLVDSAHRHGLMVFLDVVYNHFGPDGNYLHLYAPQFFTERHQTPWGAAINFDGGQRPVRDFFIHNALYWIDEFHIDGLRLDAVHAIRDDSRPDILVDLAETVRSRIDGVRQVHLVLENDDNASRYLERTDDGRPRWYTAQWNDDIHHALHAIVTGETDGYYGDYADDPVRHLGRALVEGFSYQGEASKHRGGVSRGEPSAHLPPSAFVSFLQNHDQVGNRAFGDRIATIAEPEAVRAAMSVMLLAPSIPLLFMGEEWGSTQPFPFFCDFGAELADLVREGRRREFERFPEFSDAAARERIPDPNSAATFEEAVLDWSAPESKQGRDWLNFISRLLALRREEIVPHLAGLRGNSGRFTRHGPYGLFASWSLGGDAQLSLCANLGGAAFVDAPPKPEGRKIFVLDDGTAHGLEVRRWPPWFVAWLSSASRRQSQ